MLEEYTVLNTEIKQRLYNLQKTRTYEYYIFHNRAIGPLSIVAQEYSDMWINRPSYDFTNTWYQNLSENIKNYPNIKQKYIRMVNAKIAFEDAGGLYPVKWYAPNIITHGVISNDQTIFAGPNH